jgi:hypothetical protein
MSVNWAELSTPEDTIGQFQAWQGRKGVASITAKVFWDVGRTIEYDPLADNSAHTAIVGDDSKKIRRLLAKNAELVYESPSEGQS